MFADEGGERTGSFIVTREHGRFIEFADAASNTATSAFAMALLASEKPCPPDVMPDGISPNRFCLKRDHALIPTSKSMLPWRAVFYIPTVGVTLRELRHDLRQVITGTDVCIKEQVRPKGSLPYRSRSIYPELVTVDEAERLSMTALEYLRDLFDRP